MGKQTFVLIANPQILGLIPFSQIHKFLWLILQSKNSQILQNVSQLYLKIVLKVVYLFADLFCGSFESANHKSLGLKITNQQSDTFSEGPQNLTNYLSPQICGPLGKSLIWNELRFEQSGQKESC